MTSIARNGITFCSLAIVEDPLEGPVAITPPFVVSHPLVGLTGREDRMGIGSKPVGALEGADVSPDHQNTAPRIGPMPGKLVRIRPSRPARKRCLSSSSILLTRSLRLRTSMVSPATIEAATPCASRLTL